MGWLDHRYLDSPIATPEQLADVMTVSYISHCAAGGGGPASMPATDATATTSGVSGNPTSAESFRRPVIRIGGRMRAAGWLRDGGVVYNPGRRHASRARPDHASGFAHFRRTPVLGILTMLDGGWGEHLLRRSATPTRRRCGRPFADDDRVMTGRSTKAGRWPYTGKMDDRAADSARNLPVPVEFNDTNWPYRRRGVMPHRRAVRPRTPWSCNAARTAWPTIP